jgi:carbon-monoxide dehydrogenase large subunit
VNSYPTFSNGAYLAVVEVDPETGRVVIRRLAVVHDCGVIVNPALVDGQLRGAVAMGAGGAIAEVVRSAPDGRRLTASFREYLMPRAGDLPAIDVAHCVTPSPNTLLGTKGGGEAGVGGAIAAVTNAVADALVPMGIEILDLPLDPPALWRLVRDARRRAAAAEP